MKLFSPTLFARSALFALGAVFSLNTAMAQAPAPTLAPVSEPSDAHLTVAIEVVKLSGMARSIDLIVPQMVDKARQLFSKMRPELAAEIEKSIKDLQPDFDVQKQLSLQIAGRAFALRLPETELKDIAIFFSSPAGKKFVDNQPAILEQMFRDLDSYSQQLSQVIVEKLRADLTKKGHPF